MALGRLGSFLLVLDGFLTFDAANVYLSLRPYEVSDQNKGAEKK